MECATNKIVIALIFLFWASIRQLAEQINEISEIFRDK